MREAIKIMVYKYEKFFEFLVLKITMDFFYLTFTPVEPL